MVKRILPTGTKLIVIDPGENGFDPFADVKIKATKGSNTDVLNALKAAVKKQNVSDLTGISEVRFADCR